jgi:hypothetical protein
MSTHASLNTELKADLKPGPHAQASRSADMHAAYNRGMRRTITREQGVALEMLGHAVDYLNDSYLQEGPDGDFLDFGAPEIIAAQILASAQRQILHSLPLTEPFALRFWNALLRRKSQLKSSPVLPLSSR